MAFVRFILGAPIPLAPIIPLVPGVATALPPQLNHTAGLYLIYNQPQNNRYMGVTVDFQNRFAARQGACFELGFPQGVLNNVFAFIGRMEYSNDGFAWVPAAGYAGASLIINLGGHDYDFEAIFIKAAQHAWPQATITNTVKTAPLVNLGANPIQINISWLGVAPGNIATNIPVGGQLA
jgi:hypothetical protein